MKGCHMAEKVYVYVYPNPRGRGAATTGYFIGDPFDTVADARAFVLNGNQNNPHFAKLGKCRLVPSSALL